MNAKRDGKPLVYKPTTGLFLEAIKSRGDAIARGDLIREHPQRPNSIDGYPQRARSAEGPTPKRWEPLADGSPDVEEKKRISPKAPPPALPANTLMQEAVKPENFQERRVRD